jgi:hypothetical protein
MVQWKERRTTAGDFNCWIYLFTVCSEKCLVDWDLNPNLDPGFLLNPDPDRIFITRIERKRSFALKCFIYLRRRMPLVVSKIKLAEIQLSGL